jgi:PAS domain S-box-containing protein
MDPKPTREELEEKIRQLELEVSRLRNARESLIEGEERYRTILDGIEDGYYEVDLAGNLTFFNPQLSRVLGYTEEEIAGSNNRLIMTSKGAKETFRVFNEVFRTGKPVQICDWEILTKEGTPRYIESSVTLIRDSKGQPIGFRGIGRDITEKKKAAEQAMLHQQQLFHASKMVALGTLVSGVAHEINNPNNFIMLNTPLLMEAWESARPILDEYLETNGDFMIAGMNYSEMRGYIPTLFSGIIDGSKRIRQIVEDLKNFLRKDGSDLNQTIDMNGVLRSAVSLLSNMIQKSTSRFSVNYGPNLPILKGSFQRLEQVVINLIQNACQALTDPHQAITVSTACDGNRVSLIVLDEGGGHPAGEPVTDIRPVLHDPAGFRRHRAGAGDILTDR